MAATEAAARRALLDVNVLIALHDEQHVHHKPAADWLAANARAGWATCPLTQNGCVRILCQPNYPNAVTLGDAFAALSHFCSHPRHEFWPDDISLLDSAIIDHERIHGHRQVTDLYLLALAVANRGRFVTFDDRVVTSAVRAARKEHLVVI